MAVVNLQTLPLTPLPDFGIPTVIYTRVSSDATGEERSCNEQETEVHDDLSHYADRMREPLSVIAALRDPNVPASRYSKKDRPDWVRLLQMIESDLVKVVAFWEMPRATRRLTEWAEFAELAEEKELHVFLRGRMYDCRNPGDMAYLTSLVVRGIEEVGHARERIQRTKRSRAEEGRPDGSICFGLRSVYDQRTGALLTREPDTDPWPRPDGRWTPAGLVQEAADRILSGESRWSVCVEWNDRGVPSPRGKRWSVTSLRAHLIW